MLPVQSVKDVPVPTRAVQPGDIGDNAGRRYRGGGSLATWVTKPAGDAVAGGRLAGLGGLGGLQLRAVSIRYRF